MDKNYWKNIYSKKSEEEKPSLFALYVSETLQLAGKKVIELGCGNGRDAIFFANDNAAKVVAIDQCENIIELLQHRFQRLNNLQFICLDFTNLDDSTQYDIVYSRFTLHSISKEQEEKVLRWAFRNLNPNGKLCIEVRGQKNEIYQVGTPVDGEPDAFILNDHYRRFLHFETLCEELKAIGFRIDFAAEEKGFAPFNGQDETYIRVIGSK
ncbi:MAG: class I SAM-dependent methyltransferase [Bacteroidales bacterium]|nr:class I SAM-dependent methyltransferase [Bacteroidales bacterium]